MPISHGINDRAKRPSAITKEISSDTEQSFSVVNLAEYIVNMGGDQKQLRTSFNLSPPLPPPNCIGIAALRS